MAEVQVVFSDDIHCWGEADKYEDDIRAFLKKHESVLGADLVKDFYFKDDEGIYILYCLNDLTVSTHDKEQKNKSILNLFSKTVGENVPEFGFGYDGFSGEFYSELFNALPDYLTVEFAMTVIGYGDEYTRCVYTLTQEGWNITCDLYVWDEEEDSYKYSDS